MNKRAAAFSGGFCAEASSHLIELMDFSVGRPRHGFEARIHAGEPHPSFCNSNLGLFREKNDCRIGNHESIIRHELFAAVVAQLDGRRTRAPRKHYEIEWPLQDGTSADVGVPVPKRERSGLVVTARATADSARSRNPVGYLSREERPTPGRLRRSRRPGD